MDSEESVSLIETTIPSDKKNILKAHQQRIEQRFEISIVFGLKSGDGLQWITISGPEATLKDAQLYICSLCSPKEVQNLSVKADVFIFLSRGDTLAKIEKSSGAVILQTSPNAAGIGMLHIYAPDSICATLAFSAIEDLTSSGVIGKSPVATQSSQRLTEELRRLSSEEGLQLDNVDDINGYDNDMKRALLNSLKDDQTPAKDSSNAAQDSPTNVTPPPSNGFGSPAMHSPYLGEKLSYTLIPPHVYSSPKAKDNGSYFQQASSSIASASPTAAADNSNEVYLKTKKISSSAVADSSSTGEVPPTFFCGTPDQPSSSKDRCSNFQFPKTPSDNGEYELKQPSAFTASSSKPAVSPTRSYLGGSASAFRPIFSADLEEESLRRFDTNGPLIDLTLPSTSKESSRTPPTGPFFDLTLPSTGNGPLIPPQRELNTDYYLALAAQEADEDMDFDEIGKLIQTLGSSITEETLKKEVQKLKDERQMEVQPSCSVFPRAPSVDELVSTNSGLRPKLLTDYTAKKHREKVRDSERNRSPGTFAHDGCQFKAPASTTSPHSFERQNSFERQKQLRQQHQEQIDLESTESGSSGDESGFAQPTRRRKVSKSAKRRQANQERSSSAKNYARVAPKREEIDGPRCGSSFAFGSQDASDTCSLRYIIIDASNIAMHHGNNQVFSCRGIQIAIDYFLKRGHTNVVAMVPQWRRRQQKDPIRDQHILEELDKTKYLTFTPSRRVGTKTIVPYDDRMMLNLAEEKDGIVVTNDNFRDLYDEQPRYRPLIAKNLLPYSFVGDSLLFPDDPLGRDGPTLSQFLAKEKSTATFSVGYTDLRNQIGVGHRAAYGPGPRWGQPFPSQPPMRSMFRPVGGVQMGPPRAGSGGMQMGPPRAGTSGSHPRDPSHGKDRNKMSRSYSPENGRQRSNLRSASSTANLRSRMLEFLPGCDAIVDRILKNHGEETDLNRLVNYATDIVSS